MNIPEEINNFDCIFNAAHKRGMERYGLEESIDFETLDLKYTAEELFDMLPPHVVDNGNYYHFELVKGNNGVLIFYKRNQSEGSACLRQTYLRDYKLKSALIKTYIFLKRGQYI